MSSKLSKIISVAVTAAAVVVLSSFTVSVPRAQADAISDLLAQINALQAQLAALQAGSGTFVLCTFTRALTVGSTGSDVMCLQKYLNDGGHQQVSATGAGSAGNESSYFGLKTKAAVAAWQAAHGVSPAVGYFGVISRAKYSALVAINATTPPPGPPGPPGPPAPPSVGTGLLISSATQPANALAPKNAARVPFTTFTLTAGADGAVTVNGITIQRQGPSVDSNFSGIVLLDGNGSVMDISKTLNSDHKAIIGGTFMVPAGTSKNYTVAGNIASSPNGGEIAQLAVVAVNTSASVTGSLPILGASHTINSTLAIGSITAAKGPADPAPGTNTAINLDIGTLAKIFSEVRLTAGSGEKLWFRQIRWNQSGSAAASDLGNVKTVVAGVMYDTVPSTDGKYYTTTFPGNGILVDKGNNIDVRVIGDVLGGSGRDINFDIYRRDTDVYAVGDTYGYGVIPANGSSVPTANTGAVSSSQPWYDGGKFTIQKGSLNVAKDNAVGAQNIAVNLSNQPLAGFTVDTKGEAISVASMIFNLNFQENSGSALSFDDLTNVTLAKSDGTVIAGPVDGVSTSNKITFTDTVTFPPMVTGVTHLVLRGKLGTDFASNDTIAASTTPSSDWTSITGQTTGQSITAAPTSAVTGNTMTVKSAALTISVQSVPIAQTIVAGATYTFANYNFDAGSSGEDIRVTSWPFEYNATSTTDLTNCQIYDGATSVTNGSNIVNPTAAASSTVFTFDGAGIVIPKGSTKVYALKCNLKAGATGVYEWGYDPSASPTATGVNSGQSATITEGGSPGQAQTASAGASLSVALDSGSPSYAIAYPGQTVELSRIKYSATNEDINLRVVALQLNSPASNTPVDLVGQQVTLWTTTGTQVGTATFSSGDYATSTLNDSSFIIPKDGARVLVVKGQIAGISNSGPLTASGDLVRADYDGDNEGLGGNYGIGVSSGTTITPAVNDTGSNGVRIMKNYPSFTFIPLTSPTETTLTFGDGKPVYKFKVMANGDTSTGGNEIALYKFTFAVSSSTQSATTSKFSLYAFTDAGFSTPDSNFNGTNNPGGLVNAGSCYGRSSNSLTMNGRFAEIYPEKTSTTCGAGATTTLQIPVGDSRWFRLDASIAQIGAIATSNSFQVQLEGDAAYPAPTGGYLTSSNMFTASTTDLYDPNNDFIWSPRSTSTTASVSDLDFTNGYGVLGLPSTNMTGQSISN